MLNRSLAGCLLAVAATLIQTGANAAEAPVVKAPQVDTPTHVLLVGNSYLYYGDSLHNHLRRMVMAADESLVKKLKYKSATTGGASLAQHNIDYLTAPGKIGVKEAFQVVLLQGGSTEPLSEEKRTGFRQAAVAANKIILERGGKTALYMTHAYVAPHKKTKPENIRLTEDLYVSVGNEIGALVIPVGLAFEEAYRRKPDLKLHKSYDGSHPSLIGSYLAACTAYASLYGKPALGNSYDYFGAIDADTARFLQQVADDTAKAFYAR